jgi:glutathione S-transferase
VVALYAHPFSSYCWKVLIALYEHGMTFDYRQLGGDPAIAAEHARLWPLKKMPVLEDRVRGQTVFEASCIIEYLDLHHAGGARLLPADPAAALAVRLLDRCFDQYVMTPMQKIVADCIRDPAQRDPLGVVEARQLLDAIYPWLDSQLAGRCWAAGEDFTLADCAAAPSLFYADWVHPIPPALTTLRAYRARLLARPAIARCVDEARPYRHFFPPGAPDRD